MIDKKYNKTDNYMIDINYKQDANGIEVVAILDKLYVCASVEFLLTVADFFIKSMPTASTERSTQVQLKHAPGKPKHDKGLQKCIWLFKESLGGRKHPEKHNLLIFF